MCILPAADEGVALLCHVGSSLSPPLFLVPAAGSVEFAEPGSRVPLVWSSLRGPSLGSRLQTRVQAMNSPSREVFAESVLGVRLCWSWAVCEHFLFWIERESLHKRTGNCGEQ